ncbi:MAG: hypothetical protein RQM90_15450 [Methanoculleus sp.]
MTQTVTIDELYIEIKKIQETMVRREDLDALLDTIEILSDPEAMATIQKSEDDIVAGRYREISSIDDLLSEHPDGMDDNELGKKLQRLKQDPLNTGGWLSGALHGKKATRIAKRYRLIFLPDERERTVYLIAIDHRRHIYGLR